MSVPRGRPHRHTLPNALALCTHIHADTCRHAIYLLPQLWSLLSFAQTKKSAYFCPIFHHRIFYNVTQILLDEKEGKSLAQIPVVVYPPVQASWVGKVPVSVWQLSPPPAERRANTAPVSPPSRFGGKFFLAQLELLVGLVWSA